MYARTLVGTVVRLVWPTVIVHVLESCSHSGYRQASVAACSSWISTWSGGVSLRSCSSNILYLVASIMAFVCILYRGYIW